MSSPKTVVICSSASFYKHVNEIADELVKRGIKAIVPESADKMRANGDYSVEDSRTWRPKDLSDFKIKTRLMRAHFDEIASGDAVLVVNDEKRGVQGYIGGNVLMEMGLAFYLGKPIYILNKVDEAGPVYEEVRAMNSIMLDGDLSKIKL